MRISPQADVDFDEHFAFFARTSIDVAVRFFDAVHSTCKQLAAQPWLGRARHFADPRFNDLRSWPVKGFKNWLIFYRKVPGGIEVVRILHGARNINRIFGGTP